MFSIKDIKEQKQNAINVLAKDNQFLTIAYVEEDFRMLEGVTAKFNSIPVKVFVEPKDGEILILTFDTNINDLDNVVYAYNHLVEQYPNCHVLAIPKEVTLEYGNRDFLLNLYYKLRDVLEIKDALEDFKKHNWN